MQQITRLFPARDTSRGIIASTRNHSGTAAITPTVCVAGAFVELTVGDNRCDLESGRVLSATRIKKIRCTLPVKVTHLESGSCRNQAP